MIAPRKQRNNHTTVSICITVLILLAACQGRVEAATTATTTPATPTLTVKPIARTMNTQPPPNLPPSSPHFLTSQQTQGSARPVLAFYYMWYNTSTWSSSTMPDLPTTKYNSSDDATIQRQVSLAANAGLTGFISSWWGAGDQTDTNFAKLLRSSATLERQTGYHFVSTMYFESDSPALQGTSKIVSALHYMVAQYSRDPHFFHWQGKPVFFFWDPLGKGRTLAQWAWIRRQVDPSHQMIWSAEGVSPTLLDVFDGIHLFSGGYWGLRSNTMTAVDQGFRRKVDAYNSVNGTSKIWAAGVIPGYDDTRVPGRKGTYSIARNNGVIYGTEWQAAMASNPEWITITSFNEWFEGSMIEPGATYGTLYLNLTQHYIQQWHG